MMSAGRDVVRLPIIRTFSSRVVQVMVTQAGPVCAVREIQKRLRKSLSDNIKDRYKLLVCSKYLNRNFFTVYEVKTCRMNV